MPVSAGVEAYSSRHCYNVEKICQKYFISSSGAGALRGAGHLLSPVFPLARLLPHPLLFFYFFLFSSALTIFFFCPSLSFLPE